MRLMINPELLRILACPMCKSDLRLEKSELICIKCGRRYPIKDGIPHLLPDELREPQR
jgi:uncharacterized protein YbaR (Trm112 family)